MTRLHITFCTVSTSEETRARDRGKKFYFKNKKMRSKESDTTITNHFNESERMERKSSTQCDVKFYSEIMFSIFIKCYKVLKVKSVIENI